MTNARNSFVFTKRDEKISTQLRQNDASPTRQCATACCSRCDLDTMPRHRRADAPQPAAAAAPVILLVSFLLVCLCSGAATAPSEIYNGCWCVVEVPAASHFGACNPYDSDSDGTLIKCVGCNMRWYSYVSHHNGDITTASHSSMAWKVMGSLRTGVQDALAINQRPVLILATRQIQTSSGTTSWLTTARAQMQGNSRLQRSR